MPASYPRQFTFWVVTHTATIGVERHYDGVMRVHLAQLDDYDEEDWAPSFVQLVTHVERLRDHMA